MKTKSAPRSAFFNPRFLLSFSFCAIGGLLVLMALALYPGATALAESEGPPQKQSDAPARAISSIQGGPTLAGQLIISEYRVRGPSGTNDEFIDLYNTTDDALSVQSADGSPGLALVASDGVPRCIVPNLTVIPRGGHYLCANTVGYSLSNYPSGNGTTATPDATFVLDIPNQAGLALFNNSSGGASFSVANRLDAAGPNTVGALYREGAGLSPLTPFSIDHAWVRRWPGGCTGSAGGESGNCTTFSAIANTSGPTSIQPRDSGDNTTDFIFVDSNGTSAGAGQRLGAPGPQNLAGPGAIEFPTSAPIPNFRVLDPCAFETSPPNYIRDLTSDPDNNASLGTLDIRKTFTNLGNPITRLRFRIVDITTFPTPMGVAQLRPLTSTDITAAVDRSPCFSGGSSVVVHGTTLEQPPNQPNGGGYNSSLSVDAVTPATPLANAASIDVRFRLGVEQNGIARFCVMSETVPASPSRVSCFTPVDTTPPNGPNCAATIFSEDFDTAILPDLPPGWASTFTNGAANCTPTGTCALGEHWELAGSAIRADTIFNYVQHDDPACVTDSILDSPPIPISAAGAQITFRNWYDTENGFDGGVLEISSPNINGGVFTDILATGATFVSGGYNAAISPNFLSPIAARPAWTGNSVGYVTTRINLPATMTNQSIRLRFRAASDCSVGVPLGGWKIDTIKVTAGTCGAQALNISTRMQVQTGNNVLIAGFIVTGNTTKKVAVRGIGPSLTQFGVPGALADPTLELRDSSGTLLVQNDNWQDNPSQAAQLTTLGLAPQNPLESGIVATLAPSASYTAILAGKNDGTGVGLVELYDVGQAADSQLANISTRGFVLNGNDVMIGGFILNGASDTRVVVRGIGPSLAQFGINPALADPTLELRDNNGAVLVANDNWQDNPAQAALLTSSGFALGNPNESGIFTSLPPGPFTAIVAGKNGGTGIGLVEIYNVH